MLSYILRRALYLVPTLIGITLVTFLIVNLAPGDPVALIGQGGPVSISPEAYQAMKHQFGLDRPMHVRYFVWLKNLAWLDFGASFKDRRPVFEKIWERLPATITLNLAALILAFGLALPMGLLSAVKQHSWFDKLNGTILYVLYSLPNFWISLVLILLVGVHLKLLPFVGLKSDDHASLGPLARLGDLASHLVLPAVCLAYTSLAYFSRFVRGVTLEVVRQDYIRTARAKGLSPGTVLRRHIFRNALVPLVTLLAIVLPGVISGSIIIEKIFSWPGTGRLFIESALARDYPTVMGLSFLSALLVLVCTLLADIGYAIVDPRIRYK